MAQKFNHVTINGKQYHEYSGGTVTLPCDCKTTVPEPVVKKTKVHKRKKK